MEPIISTITTGEKTYEFNGQMYTKEQYEMILDRWGLRDDAYIVSLIKKQVQGENVSLPYIEKYAIVPIVEEMLYDDYLSYNSQGYQAIYDFICEHWNRIENGYSLRYLTCCLEQCKDNIWVNLIPQLKRRLKKQIDKDGYITIYRGFNDHSREDGNSFTLSRNIAIWFSRRFAEEISYVNTYKIHIEDVLAFITNRGEAEIIADAERVILLETNSYSDKVKISAGCKVEFINN